MSTCVQRAPLKPMCPTGILESGTSTYYSQDLSKPSETATTEHLKLQPSATDPEDPELGCCRPFTRGGASSSKDAEKAPKMLPTRKQRAKVMGHSLST